MAKLTDDIAVLIKAFQQNLQQHIPALEQEVQQLIAGKSKDKNSIENTLDTLLSLMDFGVGDGLYIQLLEYYKTVDAEGADFYWNEYDKKDEE
jgi:uncharacterized protein YlxW (UPF0749 family)